MITFKIDLKNGSSIETLESEGEVVRGKRSELPYWYNDCDLCYDEEMVDEVLKPFCNTEKLFKKIGWWKKHPSDYILYVTGTKLPLWQQIWIDKISPLFRRWLQKFGIHNCR